MTVDGALNVHIHIRIYNEWNGMEWCGLVSALADVYVFLCTCSTGQVCQMSLNVFRTEG